MNIFRYIRAIPIVGPAFRIANSYAYQGDYQADESFAGFRRWMRAMGPELLIALVLTAITLWSHIQCVWNARELIQCPAEAFYCKPGALTVSIVPSILGFGIGVYALVFSLSNAFVKAVHETIQSQKSEGKRQAGSELMINADLGYPLLVLLIALVIGVLQQALPDSMFMIVLSWLSAWYALLSILSIVYVIFGLAEHSLLDKRQ